jgi:hypothetical protein
VYCCQICKRKAGYVIKKQKRQEERDAKKLKNLKLMPCNQCKEPFTPERHGQVNCQNCFKTLSTIYKRWSTDAMYCHNSNSNCGQCPTNQAYQISQWCKMPDAVDKMVAYGLPLPKHKVFEQPELITE